MRHQDLFRDFVFERLAVGKAQEVGDCVIRHAVNFNVQRSGDVVLAVRKVIADHIRRAERLFQRNRAALGTRRNDDDIQAVRLEHLPHPGGDCAGADQGDRFTVDAGAAARGAPALETLAFRSIREIILQRKNDLRNHEFRDGDCVCLPGSAFRRTALP